MPAPLKLHIATISNNLSAYADMRESMAAFGYTEDRCRFTLFDNSQSNRHEPFNVLRELPADGDEPYVVLCHQDLRFSVDSSMDRLLAEIDRLDQSDSRWAVAGTAGCSKGGEFFVHLDEPAGSFRAKGCPRAWCRWMKISCCCDERRLRLSATACTASTSTALTSV